MSYILGEKGIKGKVAHFTNSTGYCEIDPLTTVFVCTLDIYFKKNIITLNEEDNEFLYL
jgi:hypothetical protein